MRYNKSVSRTHALKCAPALDTVLFGYLVSNWGGGACEVKGSGLVEVKFGMEDLPKAQRVSYSNQKS